jgi:predicted nucleotidyltransferase
MLAPVETKVPLPETLVEVLEGLDRGLRGLYGERYRGLVLFGSYARGEAEEGSDVDLLLLLDGEVDPTREIIRAESVTWPLALESGYLLALLPVSVEAFTGSGSPLMLNARKEGVPIP